ncbi:histidine kinase [Reichenbachiella agarivorans]|uniref:Histidine kinase n=1 Tax=Reichenbachiella agarivorans TaxID=2979464 RepID=A0ABY6CT79_9BACT|nr:histidine kinase [Reichenbachiella agarivorans]UXP33729.1 histidine kinase [Reichenbachiella agarivorans]
MSMTKQSIYWWCQIMGWSIYGLLNFGIYFFQSGRFDGKEFSIVLLQILFYVLSTHLLRAVIKRGKWVSFRISKLIPVVIASNLLLSVVNYFLLLLVSYLMGILMVSVEFRIINILFGILGPMAIYFLWSLVYFTYQFFEQYNKSLQYEAVIKEAELQHLRSQLNPHFIFNALNSIKALVDEDPLKSKMAITQLSSIFRNTLIVEKKRLVSLEEEMETVKAYLGLESIRFEERLTVALDLDVATLTNKVPPMMIQTLVENSVKHGISKLKNGGKVAVKTYYEGENMILQIRNNGHYNASNTLEKGHGTGLQNTVDRLKLIYENKATLRIFNEEDNVVLTEISIPKEY